MGFTIQINPTVPTHHMSFALYQLIDNAAEEFDLKYYSLAATRGLLERLRAFVPANDDDAAAIAALLSSLDADGVAELLVGF